MNREELIDKLIQFRYYRDAHNKYTKLSKCKKDSNLYKYEFNMFANRQSVINEILHLRKGYAFKDLNIPEIVENLLPHEKEAWLRFRI